MTLLNTSKINLQSINKLLKKTGILVQSTTSNKKTGRIPTIIVGTTAEETLQSCIDSGCAVLPEKLGGTGEYHKYGIKKPCYAWKGTVSWATKSIRRALDKGTKTIEDYTCENAFRMSERTARVFRLSSIGDCSALSHEQMKEIVSTGERYNLKPMGYTAGWKRKGKDYLKQWVLASNFTMEQADKAIDSGWRSTVILPKDTDYKTFVTPAGNKGIVCPEQTQQRINPEVTPRNKITCNTCGLCSEGNQHKSKFKVIGFINH